MWRRRGNAGASEQHLQTEPTRRGRAISNTAWITAARAAIRLSRTRATSTTAARGYDKTHARLRE